MEILIQAFVLGAVAGFIPGAVMTLLFVTVMQGGLAAGVRAFFWSMLSEITIAGGLLLIATQLPLDQGFFTVVGFIGGTVLIYFAWKVFQLRSIAVQGDTQLFTAPKILLKILLPRDHLRRIQPENVCNPRLILPLAVE